MEMEKEENIFAIIDRASALVPELAQKGVVDTAQKLKDVVADLRDFALSHRI